jgi:hypothetical protein
VQSNYLPPIFTNEKPETRNQKPDTRSKKPDTRSKKPETRNQKPEARNQKRDARFLQIFVGQGLSSLWSKIVEGERVSQL